MDARPTLIDSKHFCCQQLMTVQLLPMMPDLLRQPQNRYYLTVIDLYYRVNIVYNITHALLGLLYAVMAVIRNNE